jgi:hypothetical protein
MDIETSKIKKGSHLIIKLDEGKTVEYAVAVVVWTDNRNLIVRWLNDELSAISDVEINTDTYKVGSEKIVGIIAMNKIRTLPKNGYVDKKDIDNYIYPRHQGK